MLLAAKKSANEIYEGYGLPTRFHSGYVDPATMMVTLILPVFTVPKNSNVELLVDAAL